jgi:hypothetical protein
MSIIKSPDHYSKWAIEPIIFIMSNDLSFWRGNVIKYVVRAGSKHYVGMTPDESEITDLKKARRYIDMRLNQLEGKAIND